MAEMNEQKKSPEKPGVGFVLYLTVAMIFALVIALVFVSPPENDGDKPPVQSFGGGPQSTGYAAPDFVQRSIGGQKVSLSDYRGSLVVINFWATWCGPCKVEYPVLQKRSRDYRDKGVQFIGIAHQDKEKNVLRFVNSHGAEYPMVIDYNGRIARDYEVTGIPWTVIVDADGMVSTVFTGLFSEDKFRSVLNSVL